MDVAKADVVIVAGGGDGMNQFVAGGDRLAHKALDLNGIKREEYGVVSAGGCPQRLAAMRADAVNAAAMLNLRCNLIAVKEGYKSFGAAVDTLGSYQADAAFG